MEPQLFESGAHHRAIAMAAALVECRAYAQLASCFQTVTIPLAAQLEARGKTTRVTMAVDRLWRLRFLSVVSLPSWGLGKMWVCLVQSS
jgi:hypothetical protein